MTDTALNNPIITAVLAVKNGEDVINSPDDDDITKDDGAAIFTLNLIK